CWIARSCGRTALVLGQLVDINGLYRDLEPGSFNASNYAAYGLSIGNAKDINRSAEHGDSLFRGNGEAEALDKLCNPILRHVRGELRHPLVWRKPGLGRGRHARTRWERNDWHVDESCAKRRTVTALPSVC